MSGRNMPYIQGGMKCNNTTTEMYSFQKDERCVFKDKCTLRRNDDVERLPGHELIWGRCLPCYAMHAQYIHWKVLPIPLQIGHWSMSKIRKLTVPEPSHRQQSRPPMRESPGVTTIDPGGGGPREKPS